LESQNSAKAESRKQKGETEKATNFPAGIVLARALTDENGNFDFPNLKPGAYQLRAQVPGGRTWCDAGRIFFASPDLPATELALHKPIDFRLAPFKKGHWTQWTTVHGLPHDYVGGVVFTSDNVAWLNQPNGLSRFDGREFVSLAREEGLPGLV